MQVSEVDDHIENFTAAENMAAEGTAQFKLFDICQVWQKVRPIIRFARGLLFWKPKWQAIIDEAMAALDVSCDMS